MKTYKFILKGEVPSKKNSKRLTKYGRLIPSEKFYSWHNGAMIELLKQERPKNALDGILIIKFTFIHGTLQRRDSDNQITSILDLLKDVKIIEDDNWIIVRKIEVNNYFEKGNSQSIIEISDITAEANKWQMQSQSYQ